MSLTMSSFNRKNACVNNAGGVMKLQSRANRFLDEAIIMKGIIVDYLKGDLQFGSVKELEQIIADSYVEIDDVDVLDILQFALSEHLLYRWFVYLYADKLFIRLLFCPMQEVSAATKADLYRYVRIKKIFVERKKRGFEEFF